MFKNFAIFSIIFLVFAGVFGQSDTLGDSLNMHLVSTLDFPVGLHDMAVQGSYVFVAGGDTLYIVDIGNPASPSIVKKIYDDGGWWYVDVDDTLLCGGKYESFKVVDISDINSAAVIGTATAPVAFVTMSTNSQIVVAKGGLLIYIIDISDPTSPSVDTMIEYPGITALDLFLRDTLLYVAGCYAESFTGDGFSVAKYVILNLANTSDIEIVGYKDFYDYGYDWFDTECNSIVANANGAYVGGDYDIGTWDGFWYCEECDSLLPLLTGFVVSYQTILCNYIAIREGYINSVYETGDSCSLTLLGYYRKGIGALSLTTINDSLYLLGLGHDGLSIPNVLYIMKVDSYEVNIQDCRLDLPKRPKIFPNPISRGDKFYYTGSDADIYDIRGKRVKTISNEQKIIGTSDMPPGLYLVVPRDKNIKPQKIMIMK